MARTTPTPEQVDVERGASTPSLVRPPIVFPRLNLPSVPEFGRVVGGQDEPPAMWHSPFPQPMPVAPAPIAPAPAAATAVAAPPAPVVVAPTRGVPAPTFAASPPPPVREVETATRPSMVAISMLAFAAGLLVWSSHMAFSAALMSLAAVLVSELAVALSLSRPRGAGTPRAAIVAAAGSLGLAAFAVKGALHGFSEMAFVAGLFVILASIVTLLLIGGVALTLRLRGDRRTLADEAIRSATAVRVAVTVIVLLAGLQAHRSFSAVPDSLVAFALVALVAFHALHVLRGRRHV